MIRSAHIFGAVATIIFLAGCGSSPPVRYFALESIDGDYIAPTDTSLILVLGPLRLPDYIDRSQMVSRGGGSEIIVDDLHRWAEPLSKAIHRTVARNLDLLAAELIVVPHPAASMTDEDIRLVGRIYRFDVDQGGLAVLEVQWGVGHSNGDVMVVARRTRYTQHVASPNDPGATASALSDTLAQFSRDIASELETALRAADDTQ